ncbi:hypothetical protein BS47DRAFT_1482927 [Hydnum rufescens UP504]|uniref:Uncharacterized protein n=1 Tax=Hydnum rufescens UP504 TaxID=1448309 RepID=A0A9P6B5P5_9AGAM|nr:hypothetical protein BS47DRAFT_1482927 [Hydnum rufescens UP504]
MSSGTTRASGSVSPGDQSVGAMVRQDTVPKSPHKTHSRKRVREEKDGEASVSPKKGKGKAPAENEDYSVGMKEGTPSTPRMSPEAGRTTVATEAGQSVYIRVRRALLLPEPTPDTNLPPAGPPPTGHLYLIKGTFEDIGRYAHATVD